LIYEGIPVDRDGKTFALSYEKDKYKLAYHPKGKPWTYLANPSCVYIKITHDKNGRRVKARYKTLHCYWLTKVE
jgi:hypothetical protein